MGMQYDSTKIWMRVNLAHGYLLDGQYEAAKDLYIQNKDFKFFGRSCSEIIVDDFNYLREQGIYHPDMEKIIELIE